MNNLPEQAIRYECVDVDSAESRGFSVMTPHDAEHNNDAFRSMGEPYRWVPAVYEDNQEL